MTKTPALFLIPALLGLASAATTPGNTVQFVLLKDVTDSSGKVTQVETKTAAPGQTLTQQVTITTTKAVRAPSLRVPVPDNTFYVGDLKLPQGASALFSVDGKTFSAAPKITVTGPDGKPLTRDAKPNEYRSVRVNFPNLTAGQTLKVSYRIQVR